MGTVLNDLQNSLESRAMNLLRNELAVTNDKTKLLAFWRGITQFIELKPDNPTLRWGYGFINSFSKKMTVEKQYQKYLSLVGLKESAMHPVQRVETKRTFFAAFGQALLYLRDELPEDEDASIQALESIKNEVNNFFQKETKRAN